MKKSDLKTGMRVKLRDGEIHLVVKDIESENYGHQEVAFICENSFMPASDYKENLTHTDDEYWDIVEVFMIDDDDSLLDVRFLDLDVRHSIWKRKEQRYYLRDNFISVIKLNRGFLPENNYLNYSIKDGSFILGGKNSCKEFKTQFTDQDIIDLKIPIERFEKILVEEK